MQFRRAILFFVLVAPGVFGFAFCMFYALQDWAALQKTYAAFAHLAAGNAPLRAVFVADAMQNAHRINLFADVVWALLSAIIAAIGIHALYIREK